MNRCLKSTIEAVHAANYPIDVLNIILGYIPNFNLNRISTGTLSSVIIRDDGTLHTWGNDMYGQVSGTPKGSGFISVSCGCYHFIALKDDGTLDSWGSDEYCQVSGTPRGSEFISIFTGSHYSGALERRRHLNTSRSKEDVTCISWGLDTYNYLPNPTSYLRLFHSVIMNISKQLGQWFDYNFKLSSRIINKSGFVSVSPNDYYVVVLRDDGTLYSWGCDVCGQISQTPKGSGFTSVCVGPYHSIAIKDDGRIICWGGDPNNQIPYAPETIRCFR